MPSAGVAAGISYGAMMLIAALPAVFFVLDGSPPAQPLAEGPDEPEGESRAGDQDANT